MQGLLRWIQTRFFTLIMLLLAGGFAMLLAELLLTNHTDGLQLVAVVAAVAGAVLVLAGLFVRGRTAIGLAVLLLLLSLTGVVGTIEHLESAGGEEGERASIQPQETTPTYQQVSFRQDDDQDNKQDDERDNDAERADSEAGEGEAGEEVPPPLAPLSLAGLSLMGALVLVGVGKRDA